MAGSGQGVERPCVHFAARRAGRRFNHLPETEVVNASEQSFP